MCAAVVADKRSAKVADTVSVCASVSMMTVANPVPGDAFGGASAAPLIVVVYVMGRASARAANRPRRIIARITDRFMMSS
jgi:hypothetical protein